MNFEYERLCSHLLGQNGMFGSDFENTYLEH